MAKSVLTAEKIARAFPEPVCDDLGAMQFLPREAVDLNREETLAAVRYEDDVWLFGYGSLMWNPEVDYALRRSWNSRPDARSTAGARCGGTRACEP